MNILKSLPLLNPTVNAEPDDVTQLLKRWQSGDDDAPARLIPLVYQELREVTRIYIQRERTEQIPQTATPIHQAYSRMVNHNNLSRQDRAHFYAVAARLLRRILLEHNRNGGAPPRRGHGQKLGLNGAGSLPEKNGTALAAFSRALESFEEIYPRKSQVVELKFFGGLKTREISELLEVSEETVLHDWNFAKLWLYRELNGNAG